MNERRYLSEPQNSASWNNTKRKNNLKTLVNSTCNYSNKLATDILRNCFRNKMNTAVVNCSIKSSQEER